MRLVNAAKKSEITNRAKTPEISLYFTFLHFFLMPKVKPDEETVKFLAIFDHVIRRLATNSKELPSTIFRAIT